MSTLYHWLYCFGAGIGRAAGHSVLRFDVVSYAILSTNYCDLCFSDALRCIIDGSSGCRSTAAGVL